MDRLSEIRARCERARPVVFVDVPIRAETRVFLEHAKSDMTYLLAEVERLTARAEKAEAANRWIPVSERQPKTEDAVRGMVEVWDERDGPDTMSIDFYWEWETNVTHWRPLPEPPKGE